MALSVRNLLPTGTISRLYQFLTKRLLCATNSGNMYAYFELMRTLGSRYDPRSIENIPVGDSCPTQCVDPYRQCWLSDMYKLFKLVQSLTSLVDRHWVIFENSAKCLWRLHYLHNDCKEQLKHSLADARRYNRYAAALESAKRALAQFNDCIDVLVAH